MSAAEESTAGAEPGRDRRAANAFRQGRAIHRIRDSRDDAPGHEAQRRQHGAGLSRFSRVRRSQGSRAAGHRRRHQSVRHHLGREGIARRHRAEICAHAGRARRSRARNHRLLRLDRSHDVDDDGHHQSRRRSRHLRAASTKITAPTRFFPAPRRVSCSCSRRTGVSTATN